MSLVDYDISSDEEENKEEKKEEEKKPVIESNLKRFARWWEELIDRKPEEEPSTTEAFPKFHKSEDVPDLPNWIDDKPSSIKKPSPGKGNNRLLPPQLW